MHGLHSARRERRSRHRHLARALAALLLACGLAPAVHAASDCTGAPLPPTLERAITRGDEANSFDYTVRLRDLNGDGVAEALIYLRGPEWCGSGGCTLRVMRLRHGHWKTVNNVTVASLPLRELAHRAHGWHSLSVRVGGGGILRAHDAALDFNGRRYPGNPTMPPARPLRGSVRGHVLMDYDSHFHIVCPAIGTRATP